MRRAADRMRRRIRSLVDEAHHKIALWLCKNHRVIVWPLSGVSKMTAKYDELKERKRRIGAKTVRGMLTWAWYRFQEWLKHKIREFPGRRLVLVSEAHTTKTCTHCGTPNNNVGSSEVFCCADEACPNRAAHRDHHGARNVGIRFLTEWAGEPQQQQAPPEVIDLTLEDD
jgi:putative transposase